MKGESRKDKWGQIMEDKCHAKGPGSEEPLKDFFNKGNKVIRLCEIHIILAVIPEIKGD